MELYKYSIQIGLYLGSDESRVNYVVGYMYMLGSFTSLFISMCTYFRATAMRLGINYSSKYML